MNKTKFFFFLFTAALFIIQSCSVEKRRYTSGFYIRHSTSLTKKNTSPVSRETTVSIQEVKRKVEIEEIGKKETKRHLLAGVTLNTNSLPILYSLKPKFVVAKDSCDTLVLNNGTEILAKILEIGPKVVRYKHCDNPNGPVYVSDASEVNMVIFSNGSVEEFKAPQTPSPVVFAESNPYLASSYKIEKTSKLALAFGILAIPSLIAYLAGVVFAILAIKNGMAALRWYNREPQSFDPRIKNRAQTGIILGTVALGIVVLGIVALILAGLRII